MAKITKRGKSLIIAVDTDNVKQIKQLLLETQDIEGVDGYKLGSIPALTLGLSHLVGIAKEITDLSLIYDHQKGFTDTPDLAKHFIRAVKKSRVDALIGFPFSGPVAQQAWIKAARLADLDVLIGGEMTHKKFIRSEGGYISDSALDRIYKLALTLGVNNLVVPGNKTDRIRHYRRLAVSSRVKHVELWSPGFIAQGGKISEAAKYAGDAFHPIVGRAALNSRNRRSIVKQLVRQLDI